MSSVASKNSKPSSPNLESMKHAMIVVLQAKMNSLQRLVDDMNVTNNSLWMQLKHHENPKSKSLGQEGEASKANPPPPSQV
jgi:hypothetical protein